MLIPTVLRVDVPGRECMLRSTYHGESQHDTLPGPLSKQVHVVVKEIGVVRFDLTST